MLDRFLRRLIPDYDRTTDPSVRHRYGVVAGGVGIVLNLILFAGKLAAGLLAGAVSVTADAFNNLTDAGSSVVTLIGFHLAGKQADTDHPFGHGRMEYLSGLFISLLILLVGVELFQSSVDRILHPSLVEFSWVSAAVLVASVLVKLWLCRFNRKLGRKIGSAAMEATAADCLSDAVATSVLLLGLLAGHFFKLQLDGWLGIAVALFILRAGWGAAKDTIDPLLGKPADPQLAKDIESTVLAHEEIGGIHDLVIHDYGPGRRMLSLHAEVCADEDVMLLHDVIDNVEREVRRVYGIEAVIHMDPVRNDELTIQLRGKVAVLVHAIDPAMSIHDFRMVQGPSHTNLIFDVVVPHGFRLSDDQIRRAVQEAVSVLDGTYYVVLQVDHSYVEE